MISETANPELCDRTAMAKSSKLSKYANSELNNR
jgi:hypothetical protein